MAERRTCSECGRDLRTPASRARGRGPVCDAKVRPPAPAPATLPGLAGRAGAGQDGPDLLDGVAADPAEGGTS